MRLLSLATAAPPAAYTPADCWGLVERSRLHERLRPVSLRIIRKLLHSDLGVDRRHFALPAVERLFDAGPDELAEAFRAAAPALATAALVPALERAGLAPAELDALYICTCTGYLCPGVSSYVAERLGLGPATVLHDVVGLGCGAALPTWRAVSHHLAARPGDRVAAIAVEICSAAFYLDDDPGVIVSALLFGDGAAATIWTGGPARPGDWTAGDFRSLHQPAHRDRIRFETRQGRLRNLLDKSVPGLAAAAVAQLYQESGGEGLGAVVTHTGGRDVLDALEAALPGRRLDSSRAVLRDFGNQSSPSVLFALERHLAADPTVDDVWLVSFGAGFSTHSARLSRAG